MKEREERDGEGGREGGGRRGMEREERDGGREERDGGEGGK